MQLLTDPSSNFAYRGNQFKAESDACSMEDILGHLDCAGVIPESLEHDPTEEKLYAKHCDALPTLGLTKLGLDVEMISERIEAADVWARGHNCQSVEDAKAFRMSRTTKNQKDFKIEALNQCRQGVDYACLVGPDYQYPSSNSQIYSQIIRYNVPLLSYAHLGFLVCNRNKG